MRNEIKTRLIKSIMATLVISVAFCGVVAYSQEGVPSQNRANSSSNTTYASAKVPLGVGDKLKIAFYETLDMAAKQSGRDRPDSQAALKTFYQRMDLSGEYSIEPDGAISIPLLGQFQVDGRSLDEFRADLAASFMSANGRTASVDVKIAERSPIYVVGPVKNPGAYKHVPGMIVLQAIAIAGGLDRGDPSSTIEGVRETERLRSMDLQVKQLFVRRARLEAERNGAVTMPMPVQLTMFAGEATTRVLIATEGTILKAEQSKRQQLEKQTSRRVSAARAEVEALKQKLEQSDVQKDMRTERLVDLQKLKDRGYVSSNNIVLLRTELSDIEARRLDFLVQVVQAEARLAEAEESGSRLYAEDAANLATAIATVDREIAAARESMMSATAVTSMLHRTGASSDNISYEVLRQSREGALSLQVSETSPLLPGDVLKILAKSPVSPISMPSDGTPAPQVEPTVSRINTAFESH